MTIIKDNRMERFNADIDKGWAWVVLIASYTGLFLNFMMHLMSGVFYIEFLNKFDGSPTKTSVVGALHVGLLTLAAPLGSIFSNKFSSRVAIVTGGILSSLGYITSIYVSDLNWMILTYGIIIGIGFGLSTTGFLCAMGFYFDKWQDTVLVCAFIVMGISILAPTPFAIYLLDQYGLNTTLAILACMALQICVLGTLCNPSSKEKPNNTNITYDTKDTNIQQSCVFDIKLLKLKSFSCFLLSVTSWNFAFAVAIIHFPKYVSVLGGSSENIKIQTTAFAVANVVGRLIGTIVVSKARVKSMYVYVGSVGITGVLTSLFILYSTSDEGMYAFTIQLGIFVGIPCAIMTPMSLHFVGPEKLPESHGLSLLFAGIGVSSGPIVIGYVYEQTGSYENSFIVAGVMLLVGSLLGGCAIFWKTNQATTDHTNQEIKSVAGSLQNGQTDAVISSEEDKSDSRYFHESTHL